MYFIRTGEKKLKQYPGCEYKTGLNIITLNSSKLKLFAADSTILLFMIGSETIYIRCVLILPSSKITHNKGLMSLTSDQGKVILSDVYNIYNPDTLIKFNLHRPYCKRNNTMNIYNYPPHRYYNYYIDMCSYHGHINVLEWWKRSGLEFKYSESSLDWASKYGHINVLEWWKNSGLELKYSEYSLDWASKNGHINVLTWWKNSGLPLKYSGDALYNPTINKHINVLEWWKHSGLELKYPKIFRSKLAYDVPRIALEWWKNSGLPFDK